MTARDKEFDAATGGGPDGAADAGERNLAPATQSPHTPASGGPPAGVSRAHESARAQVHDASPQPRAVIGGLLDSVRQQAQAVRRQALHQRVHQSHKLPSRCKRFTGK